MDSMTGDAPVRPVVESGDTGAWKASEAEEDSASMLSRLGRLRLRSRHKSSTKYTHTISILSVRALRGHCNSYPPICGSSCHCCCCSWSHRACEARAAARTSYVDELRRLLHISQPAPTRVNLAGSSRR